MNEAKIVAVVNKEGHPFILQDDDCAVEVSK